MRNEIALAALLLAVGAAESGAQETPAAGELRALVEELGSPDYATREAAEARLDEIGEPARPFLEEGAKSEDFEMRSRAERILARLPFVFLKGGELEKWNKELVAGFLSREVAAQERAAVRLAHDFVGNRARPSVEHEGERVPDQALDDARRVLLLIQERPMPGRDGEARLAIQLALAWLGDRDSFLALLSNEDAVPLIRARDFPESGWVYRGTVSSALEIGSRVEGDKRLFMAALLMSVLARDATAGRAPTEADRTQTIEFARTLDPASDEAGPLVRGGLLVALGEMEGLAQFAEALAQTDPWEQQAWATTCLGAYRPAARLPELVIAASKLDEQDLGTLSGVILEWFSGYTPEELAGLLAHAEPRVRELAVSAVGLQKIEAQKDALPALLSDPVYEVRLAAAWSLGELGETDAGRSAARSALASENPEEVRDALWVLVELRDPELAERALPLLSDARPDVRAAAALALTRPVKGTPVPVAALEPLLGDTAECRFYPRPGEPLESGTVGEAVRRYLGK